MRITSKARLERAQLDKPEKQPRKSFFASRWFIISGIMVLLFVVVAFSRELYRKTQLTSEINRIAQEISSLQSNNEELAALIDYYQTENYQELSARENLGLTTRGEVVIAIPGGQNTNAPVEETIDYAADPDISNLNKWWNYFFSPRN